MSETPASSDQHPSLAPRPAPGLVSLVIPMYNEEAVLPLLRERLGKLIDGWEWQTEIIAVDDGSRDRTLALLREWAGADSRLKVIGFSRNFGHQSAIAAGMAYSHGDCVVIMDADLQDPPELVADMVAGYREGFDVVYAQRIAREGETPFKRASAAAFYWLMQKLVMRSLPRDTGDYRLLSRRAVNQLAALREKNLFLRGLAAWIGFPQQAIPYTRSARAAGQTKYSLLKMLRLASDAAFSFSDMPLRVITGFGFLTVLLTLLYGAFLFVRRLIEPEAFVTGWTSIALFVGFFSGVILFSLGIIGLYVGRIYTEIKDRPLYIVDTAFNLDAASEKAREKNG